jgi:hypothetical protein
MNTISVETKVETLGLLEHISLGTVKVNKIIETNYSISCGEQYRYYPDWIRHWVCGFRLLMPGKDLISTTISQLKDF